MIDVVNEGYGDIVLSKFIYVHMDKLDQYPDNYDDRLHGYLYIWDYTYNKFTHDNTDRVRTHADVIDSMPFEIRKAYRGYLSSPLSAWGKTEVYINGKVIFYISDTELDKSSIDYIKSKMRGI